MKNKLIAYILSLTMLMTCFVPCNVYAAIDSVGTASFITEKVQNNEALEDEQLKVTTEGSVLSISGRTQLTPLECTEEGEVGLYVTSFRNVDTKAFGAPYIAMEPVEQTGQDGNPVYVFEGTYDFSDVADGTYVMYLWRGKLGTDKKYDFGSSWGKGILSYDTVIRVTSGTVNILHYNDIMKENQRVVSEMNAEGTGDFLDPTLSDIFFVNRDPQVSGDKGSGLTSSQVSYIQTRAEEITADCTTDYQKIKTLYEFTAENLYYDTDRSKDSSAFANPYYNLYSMDKKIDNNYNAAEGKAATVCTGYSAMVVAMARALGIPSRLVNGVHPAIESQQWSEVSDLETENHHWAECYVDGRWIMVDSTMGTQNEYDLSNDTWTKTGVSNYTYFDPTDEQVAVHYLIHGIYRVDDPVLTNVTGLKTKSRGTTSIGVSWNEMTGATGLTGYYVRCLSSSRAFLGGMHVTEGTSYTFKNLGAGKAYIIQVCGYGVANGEKTYGKYSEIKTCTIPNKVINLKTTKGTTTIKASWSARTASGYHVRIYDANGNFLKGTHMTSTSYTFTGLSSGKNYTVKVRPYVTVNGVKYYNAYTSAKTCTVPAKVSTLSTVKGVSTIKAKWGKSSGASGYYVQILNSSGTVLLGKYVTGTTNTFTKLGTCKTYQIRVRPYKTLNGVKQFGAYRTVTTCTVPNKVILKNPTTGSSHYVKVNWYQRTCSGYQVMIATNSSFTKGVKTYIVSSSKTTSKKITNLTKGKYYYVKVRAYKSLNSTKYYGSWSSYKSIKCK